MDFDLKCVDNICPICESKMKEYKSVAVRETNCLNGCYAFTFLDIVDMYHCKVFDDIIELKESEKIKEKIRFWRENDRYVMKILEKNSY